VLLSAMRGVLSDVWCIVTRPFRKQLISKFPMLPATEGAAFLALLDGCKSVLEFGGGGSTVYANAAGIEIVSVESDHAFFCALHDTLIGCGIGGGTRLIYADVGPTGKYGMPIFAIFRRDLSVCGLRYVLAGYEAYSNRFADLIFIDGRWRVACCLFSRIIGWKLSTLVIDDFEDARGYASLVCKYFHVRRVGRLAICTHKRDVDIVSLQRDFVMALRTPV
jgi:hypothetical protein